MAGILKSIQKKKSSDSSKKAEREGFLTLVGNAESLGISKNTQVDNRQSSAEQLLAELIEESDSVNIGGASTPDHQEGSLATKVVKRHQVVRAAERTIELKDNTLPDWAKPVSKLPPSLESSYLEIVKRVNKKVLELGCLPPHKEETFKEAIGDTNIELGNEIKLSWKIKT